METQAVNKTRTSRNHKGFSLVEAILAMTILGIATAGILTSFSASLIAGKLAEDYATADTLAGMLKAQVRADLLDPLTANTGSFTNDPDFTWQVNYTTTTMDFLYQVEIIVSWQRGQKQHVLRQQTLHYQTPDLSAV
jgi:prepilin-type N-terminal cleavage/methylation domain-containing protein